MLKPGSGTRLENGQWDSGLERLDVRALREGDEIEPLETVLTIEGDYALFAHLETVCAGADRRRMVGARRRRDRRLDRRAGVVVGPARRGDSPARADRRLRRRHGRGRNGVRAPASEMNITVRADAPAGVSTELARRREGLDRAGHGRVKIVVSGGFDVQRIREFEAAGAPVDAYGVGSSLLRGENDFTADVVRPRAKVGREERPTDRLRPVR